MPSRKMKDGDTGYVRMTVLQATSDAFQISVDDGFKLCVTVWVPARECALFEDIHNLRPIRRANPRHIDRG